MSLDVLDNAGADSSVAGWNDTLRSLEHALQHGDADQVASIAIAVTLGPVPPTMTHRATEVLEAIGRLEDEISSQMDAISRELNRHQSRPRWAAPPAPSQLDCSA